MDFEAIKRAAEGYKANMSRFLRDMISHPSESCEEKEVVMCIKAEMEKLGFDKVEIDGLGNVIGWMGEGEKIIAIDSHIDTVGIGNINNWEADPYQGYETEDIIFGRGGSDQEGGMASALKMLHPGIQLYSILTCGLCKLAVAARAKRAIRVRFLSCRKHFNGSLTYAGTDALHKGIRGHM